MSTPKTPPPINAFQKKVVDRLIESLARMNYEALDRAVKGANWKLINSDPDTARRLGGALSRPIGGFPDQVAPRWAPFCAQALNLMIRKGFDPRHAASIFHDLRKSSIVAKAIAQVAQANNLVDDRGRSVLHLAVKDAPRPDLVQAVLLPGMDVNQKDANGSTPLHTLWQTTKPGRPEHGQWTVEIMDLLVEHGADMQMRDGYGRTVSDVARAHLAYSGNRAFFGPLLIRPMELAVERAEAVCQRRQIEQSTPPLPTKAIRRGL